jgi:microcystin-dependent protein
MFGALTISLNAGPGNPQLKLYTPVGAPAQAGPLLDFVNDRIPSTNDSPGVIRFWTKDSAGAVPGGSPVIQFIGIQSSVTPGAVSAQMYISTMMAGVSNNRLVIGAGIFAPSLADMGPETINFLDIYERGHKLIPPGIVVPYAGRGAIPSGWIVCAGQAISRATYAALFAATIRSAPVTISIASPAVVTWAGHGLGVSDPIIFRTTGVLPTGIVAGTVYYVAAAGYTANSFQLMTWTGVPINTSGSQSGVHTGWYAPYGDGDGASTFNVPDLRGRVVAGMDNMGGVAANVLTNPASTLGGINGLVLGRMGGEEVHTPTYNEMWRHSHDSYTGGGRSAATGFGANGLGHASASGSVTNPQTSTEGNSTAHNNVQPTMILQHIISTGGPA